MFTNEKRKPANARWALILLICFIIFNLNGIFVFAQADPSEEDIDRYIQSNMDKNNIPGLAVAITRNDRIIWAKGYGATADEQVMTADTPLAIASLSKSFTALAVMQLIEAGRLNLDTPVVQYLPSFQLQDPRGASITIRHLLHHTSGITDMVYPDMTATPQPASLDDVLLQLKEIKLDSDPGTEYHYNNTNYQLLARIVEATSQKSFPEYLREHIFDPLGMTSTVDVSNTIQFRAMSAGTLSQGHYLFFGRAVAAAEPEWFVEGASGMVSTANDMAKWLILQLNKGTYHNVRLLSSEGIEAMHSPAGPANSYGMGWDNRTTEDGVSQIQHSGILWTYKSEAMLLPNQGLGIVLLFNSGLNAFVDYYSFVNGLKDLLTDRHQEASFFNGQMLEMCMGAMIILTFLLGLRDLLQLKQWEEKFKHLPRWRSTLSFILKLIPLYTLLGLPQIMTFIGGGRVISLVGMFMMMPSIIIWLVVASLLALVVASLRLLRIWGREH